MSFFNQKNKNYSKSKHVKNMYGDGNKTRKLRIQEQSEDKNNLKYKKNF